jgi:hypothetical protein
MEPYEELKNWYEAEDVLSICRLLFSVDLTPGQEKIVRSVAFPRANRTVICCMTRYGKSFCVSMGILLWIKGNPGKKVTIIAPTNEKTSIIRNHIYNFIVGSRLFTSLVDIDRKGFERLRKEVSRRRVTFKNRVEMRTLSAEGKGEQLMGFGADLIVVDEECDIDYEVYRARISRMLGDNPDSIYIGIGNPWHRDNQMWQHWSDPNWNKIHIEYKEALLEGRVSAAFIAEQQALLTEREFQILYAAEFPEESEDQLIPYSWIKRAVREIPEGITGLKVLGVDVARGGNDSTVFTYGIRTTENVYIAQEGEEYRKQDTMETTAKIIDLEKRIGFYRVTIDAGGLGGGPYDRLKEKKGEGFKPIIIPYEGGKSSITEFQRKTRERKEIKTRFLNIKAEAYFRLRGLFEEERIIISPALAKKYPKYIDQLLKMKWGMTTSEKIRIFDPGVAPDDSSEEKSPDFSDSLCYMCWEGVKPPMFFGRLEA